MIHPRALGYKPYSSLTEHGFMFKPRIHAVLKLEVIKHLEYEIVLSVEHEMLKS